MTRMTWIRLELPDWVHRQLKAQAALRGITLRDLLNEILKTAAESADNKGEDK